MVKQMCKNLVFIIVNGSCVTDPNVGQLTSKNVSCVHYDIVIIIRHSFINETTYFVRV